MPNQPEPTRPAAESGPARRASTERCANCTHTKGDHSGRPDHQALGSRTRPWCHDCETGCMYEPAASGVQPDTRPEPEPTRAELIRDRVNEWQKNCVWINVDGSPLVLADSWPDARSLIDAIHTAADLNAEAQPNARS